MTVSTISNTHDPIMAAAGVIVIIISALLYWVVKFALIILAAEITVWIVNQISLTLLKIKLRSKIANRK